MAFNKEGFHFIRGKGYWMKVLGAPQDNYDKNGKEWTFELEPDAEGVALLAKLEVSDRINKGENKDRILFRQRATTRDGKPTKPISVVDDRNKPWPQDMLIGNESIIDVKFKFVDNGKRMKPSLYPQAIRILDHVPYQRQEFAPLNEEDAFFKRDIEDEQFRQDFGLEENDNDEE